MSVRTRFAPSPTGSPHIGNIRSALFAWLFARHNQGDLIVRIEDTDRTRLVKGSIEKIKESLDFLKLDYDEGLDKEGEYGPYVQSQRQDLYKKYAYKLVEGKKAYHCFCSSERLDEMRQDQQKNKQAPKYDRKCLQLSETEIKEKLTAGEPYVIRFQIPEGITAFKDIVRGKVSIKNDTLDDQVILKSDGFPTYHLAVVVDDHLMKITHVIRAEEWLPSTPKHILLYQAFNWEVPEFAHLPMILGPDKKKLGKRHGATAFLDYKEQGYLPEALINFMVFLGWNPKSEREKFSLEELVKEFDLANVNRAGAIFDLEKLDSINGQYIREMSIDNFAGHCLPYLKKAGLIKSVEAGEWGVVATGKKVALDYIEQAVALEQERIRKFSDIAEAVSYFFTDELDYDPDLLVWKKMERAAVKSSLAKSLTFYKGLTEKDFTIENL
ncbi:glutamate--tRNA ligase, partial [Patescibacteria group bacterium]|nr:glutamate--tRNA ligase [Patescibacteria group bacterium]